MNYYGIHACLALWERRPNDILRVFLDESNVKTFGPLLKWCAAQRKPYRILPPSELNKVSDSVHHEGICIVANELPLLSFSRLLSHLAQKGSTVGKNRMCLLYLDGVQNPHNIGSILRTCAHFGVFYVLGEEGKLPALSSSACRIAKGGAEVVRLVSVQKPKAALQALQSKGFSLVSTSSHSKTPLYGFSFPAKTILAMGSESEGVGASLLSLAKNQIQIPGTGLVESLNVSVATSLCLGEYSRQHPSGT